MKNFIKLALIDLLIILFLFLLFEIGLRLFWEMSALKGELYMTSKNHILRYELKPNTTVGQAAINSDGLRDKEYARDKPEGVFRIIVLGDSETFSASLPLEDTMPKKLEYVLNENCQGQKFEVLNMGVQGYNTIQELEMLRYKGLKYNPDLVILYYTFNDPDYPEYYFKKNFFNRNFQTVKYFQYRIKKALVKRDRKLKNIVSEEDNFRYLYTHGSWDYTKEAILEIYSLSRQLGFKFLLVVNPEVSSEVLNFKDGYPYWYINEKLTSLNKDNIEVIDPTYFLKIKDYRVLDLVLDSQDRHKNAKAIAIITSYLIEELIKKRIIPCKSLVNS